MGSRNLRESRIAERVNRRLKTWSGDVLLADIDSPLEDERYGVLVLDFKNSNVAADIFGKYSSGLNQVLTEFCAGREEKWSYEISLNSMLDGDIPESQSLDANIFYNSQEDLDRLEEIQGGLFDDNFAVSNYRTKELGENHA